MAASTTLLNVTRWARPFVSNIFLLNDSTIEPAITNANILLGTILGPPFVWEWNRNTVAFSTVVGQTDYTETVNDFGFLESGYIQVPNGATYDSNTIFPLTLKRSLEKSTQETRPTFFEVFKDDLEGDITFRLGSFAPDQIYSTVLTYQKGFTPLTAMSDIVPIPDKLMHIFRYGFLALAFLYTQDARFKDMNQKFIATLLGAQQGLDAMQKNIFLGNWFAMMGEESAVQLGVQQGHQARGAE